MLVSGKESNIKQSERWYNPTNIEQYLINNNECQIDRTSDSVSQSIGASNNVSNTSTDECQERNFTKIALTKLKKPDTKLTPEEQIDCIVSCISVGSKMRRQAAGHDIIFVIGNTSAGKSTTLNYLLGHKIVKRLNPDKSSLSDVVLDVQKSSAGNTTKVLRIGHSAKESATLIPQIVFDTTNELVYADLPGLLETRGEEINIANAANIRSTLTGCKSVRILLLIDSRCLESDRMQSLNQSLDTTAKLFGSRQNMENKASSILIGLTRSTSSLSRVKQFIKSNCSRLENLTERIFIVDPMEKHTDALKLANFRDQLHKMTKILEPASLFQVPLTEKDTLLLQQIAKQFFDRIRECCSSHNTRFSEANNLFQQLQLLSNVGHPIVEEKLAELKELILQIQRNVCADITSKLELPATPEQRLSIRKGLMYMEACVHEFKNCMEIHKLSSILQTAKTAVKSMELREQNCINQQLKAEFKIIYHHLQSDLRDMSNKAESLEKLRHTKVETKLTIRYVIAALRKISSSHADAFQMLHNKVQQEQQLRSPKSVKYYFPEQADLTQLTNEIVNSTGELLKESALEAEKTHLYNRYEVVKTDLKDQLSQVIAQYTDKMSAGEDLNIQLIPLSNNWCNNLGFSKNSISVLIDLVRQARQFGFICLVKIIETYTKKLADQIIERVTSIQNKKRIDAWRNHILNYFAENARTYCNDSSTIKPNPLEEIARQLANLAEADVSVYEEVKKNVILTIEGHLNLEVLSQRLHDGYFAAVNSMLRGCELIRTHLKDHYNLPIEKFYKSANQVIAKMYTAALRDIDEYSHVDVSGEIINSFTLDNLRKYQEMRVELKDFSENGQLQIEKDKIVKMEEETLKQIQYLSHRIKSNEKYEVATLGLELVKIYTIVLRIRHDGNTEEFDELIRQELLPAIDDWRHYPVGMVIEKYKSNKEVGEAANLILEKFDAFIRVNRELYNKKAGGKTFELALKQLEANENAPIGVQKLEQCYAAFKMIYDNCIQKLLARTEKDRDQLNKYIRDGVKLLIYGTDQKNDNCSLIDHYEHLADYPKETGQLLGYICGEWTNLNSSGLFSGEESCLLQPHSTQLLGIMRLIGVDNCTQDGSSRTIKNHLCQMATGEGKSICLGILSTLFALFGVTVHCVCYSRHLSERDFKAFQPLFHSFGVDANIKYMTINDLSSNVMTYRIGNVRTIVPQILETTKDKFIDRRQKEEKDGNHKNVLLIDEVDIFFGQHYYGQVAHPIFTVKSESAEQILRFIWDNRCQMVGRTSSSIINSIMGEQCVQDFIKEFPKMKDLLRNEIHQMLRSIQEFPPGQRTSHKCISANNKIGYEDPVTGCISYNTLVGYSTLFAYFHYQQNLFKGTSEYIQPDVTFHHALGVTVHCGGLLFSELPNYYDLKLGITGTLKCLSPYEREILAHYDFESETYLPSLFHKQGLIEEKIELYQGKREEEYFRALRQTILDHMKNRAVLVIFENYKFLVEFAEYLQKHSLNSKSPLQLTDKLADADHNIVIAKAISRGTVTFMTKVFGRGTDFICRDSSIVQNGGVHVIQTFYSVLPSEEVQIKGRTCRQDDPGSYQLFLYFDDFPEQFHIKAFDEFPETSEEEKTQFLISKRDKYLATTLASNIENNMQSSQLVHNKTKQYIDLFHFSIKSKSDVERTDLLEQCFRIIQDISNAYYGNINE